MYIKRITIYGFGPWVDQSFTLDQSITLFYGKNESGKSTLQNFILFILFGLPPRKRKFYLPKRSGRLGGRLTIIDERIGEFTIERIETDQQAKATCYLPNGTTQDETWLQKQLKGFNLAIYESVYAFSATDLVDLENMSAKSLGDTILKIGLTGSKRIYELEKQLKDQLGNLFKPYGKNPLINQQVSQLIELQKQIVKQEEQLATYETTQLQSKKLADRIKSLLQKRHKIQTEQDHLAKLQQAIAPVQDYHYHFEQLAKLPKEIPFPNKGVERLASLKEKLIPLESELAMIVEQEKQSEETIHLARKKVLKADIFEKAKEIAKGQSVYEENVQLIARQEKKLLQEEKMLTEQLKSLNVSLTLDDLAHINFPFQTYSYWQALAKEQREIKLIENHLIEQRRSIDHEERSLQEQKQLIKSKRLSPEERQQMIDQLEQLKKASIDQKQLDIFKGYQQQRLKQRQRILRGGLILTIVSFLIGFFINQPMMMFIAILPLIFGGVIAILLKSPINTLEQMVQAENRESFADHLDEYNTLILRLEEDDALQYKFSTVQEKLKRLQIDRLQLLEKERTKNERYKRLKDQLEQIKLEFPFLKDIQLPYWAELYHELIQVKEKLTSFHLKEQELNLLKEKQESFIDQLNIVIKEIYPMVQDESVDEQWEKLQQIVDEQTQLEQQMKYERNHLKSLLKQKNRLMRQVKAFQEEIDQLFTEARVETEEAFYERASQLEIKKQSETTLEKLAQQIALIFQTKNWQSLIDRPLEQHLLTKERETLQKQVKEIKDQIEDNRQVLANKKAKISQLEQSEDYSELMHRRHREVNELNDLAKRWAVLKTAKNMLQQTMETYQQNHLQDVLKQTSLYFEQMTQGAYVQVLLTPEENILTVKTRDQLYFDLAHLSKGTLDQLYIALRLAISQSIGKKYILPFMIDDALISADHERAKTIVNILQEIAKEQQVLLFTCQREIANLFAKKQIVSLERQSHIL